MKYLHSDLINRSCNIPKQTWRLYFCFRVTPTVERMVNLVDFLMFQADMPHHHQNPGLVVNCLIA